METPFTNFNAMFDRYDAFLKNCELHIEDVPKVKGLCYHMLHEGDIRNIAHRAQRDLQMLLLGPNPNAPDLKAMVSMKCREMASRMDTLIKDHRLNYADKLPNYQRVFLVFSGFRNFHTWFLQVENPLPPLPDHVPIDWVGEARKEKGKYLGRLNQFLESCPECKRSDFVEEEIERIKALLAQPHDIESSSDYRRYKAIMKDYLVFLSDQLSNSESNAKKRRRPQEFGEMFTAQELIQDCIDVLKAVDPPILNENESYIGHSKGAFCVWVDVMKHRDLIKNFSDRSVYAELISQRFAPFKIDQSMFGKLQVRAESKYKADFVALLSKVSQKRNLGK